MIRKTSSLLLEEKKPKTRKRHLGLWFGIPGGALVVGALVASSVLLIAPGVSAAGADVSWRTPDAASDAISLHLARTEITLDVDGEDITLTGKQLGLAVDANAAAEAAHDDRPLWNVTTWGSGSVAVDVVVDPQTALESLREKAPDVFVDPVDADVEYDSDAVSYAAVDGEDGKGLDFDALSAAISEKFRDGAETVVVDAELSPVEPAITTADAEDEAGTLNDVIANAGFYIGEEKAVGVDAATAASWLTVTRGENGFAVTADEGAIGEVVKTLPEQVNRTVVDEKVITNSAGDHLRTIQEGQDGWTLDSTDGIASEYAAQLAAGDGRYVLPVEEQKAETVELYRNIEVDKSAGTTTLYENGAVVAVYSVAIGKPSTPTDEGRFTVYAQLTTQDMGDCNGNDNGFGYCTEDVPWISYFNGDQGFHGTYWHNNFGAGAMMSHGCVNMRIADAEAVYRFAQIGTEVWVHA